MADVVLRFKLGAIGTEAGEPGATASLLGFAPTVSDSSLVPLVDVTVPDGTPDGVAIVTEVFEDVLGWVLVDTDPATSIDDAARALLFGVATLRETGGPTDLAIGAVADGQVLARSGSGIVGLSVSENAILMMRRTTTFAFPTSWGDMAFDSTAVKTDSAVLEHDPGGANPERMVFGRAGNYRVSYDLVGDQPSGETLESRLRLNGSSVIVGSEDRAGPGTHNQIHIANLGRSIPIAIATPGDYLTLQTQNASTGGTVLANAILTANALTRFAI